MRIAIVEDEQMLARNLATLLESIPGHAVAASWTSAEEAAAGISPGAIDILIVDIGLPGISGIDLIRVLRANNVKLPTLVWTVHEDGELVYAALKAGANGYVLKGCPPEELELSLRQVTTGGAPISPTIACRLIQEFLAGPPPPPSAELTHREQEVLRAVAAGHSYKTIAASLGVSTHTVHTHVKNIYAKLHVKSRSEALREAQKLGVIAS